MKKVMVFGVFDGLHDGHRDLFRQAKERGRYLIAVVAQDRIVEFLKGRLPKRSLAQRIEDLQKEKLVDEVALGDAELSGYEVVKKHKPDIIVFGYDQDELKKDLGSRSEDFDWKLKIFSAKAHKPETHHSSLLKNM